MIRSVISFNYFLRELVEKRHIIFALTKRDFQVQYLGSYLGMLWAFLQPALFIAILWFVFQIGFRQGNQGTFPFVLWLMCGMIPWFFFSGCLSSATGAILGHEFLVKKMLFTVSMLPIIKILSNLIIHLVFVLILFLVFAAYGYKPDIYTVQTLYYVFALCVLLLGASWLTSSIVVFVRDVSQVVAVLLQFGFWLTPIFWSAERMSQKVTFVLKLNPLYYIITGYRDAFIYKTWFWEHPSWTLYFWIVTLFIFISGALIFRKLQPHFADVI